METEPDVHTLASLGECRRQLVLDERDDSLTLFLLIAATYTVENHCRRCLLRKIIREYFDSTGDNLTEVPMDLKQVLLHAHRLSLCICKVYCKVLDLQVREATMAGLRNCPRIQLTKQPLALVLIQVRYSPILNIPSYLPAIQDGMRRIGFPLYHTQNSYSFNLTAEGLSNIKLDQWRFGKADGKTTVLMDADQLLMQTTIYEGFEKFIAEFLSVFSVLLKVTDHGKFGIVQRLGIRYVDQVRSQFEGDTIDSYLREELRGMWSPHFLGEEKRYTISVAGKTESKPDLPGTLAIRIIRGEKGLELPPDLIAAAPERSNTFRDDEDRALIDMDHFWEGTMGPSFSIEAIEESFYRLHDTIIKAFHDTVVTPEGIEKWK